ncbi:DnaA N-terminal domain-containing protein [Caulobacter endophyticus]|uniref:DnaA N-terminal domain-containing protein n=1 Tax=Caulobacter endophyticus TaxID=2172652 RepID=UPI00240EC24D|nr:DnaA N-terminal domain-containing protein [Caulobacter endophyticus]MDG2531268.1 DnaA N-terminal domain-containing protein [Caulobacter endophyticus]
MNEEIAALRLIAYDAFVDTGFALACYGANERPNQWYRALSTMPGSRSGKVAGFEPFAPEDPHPLRAEDQRLVEVGEPWCDVFLWQGRAFVGGELELWRALAPWRAEMEQQAPLSLVQLCPSNRRAARQGYAQAAHAQLSARLGQGRADQWRDEIYIRSRVVAELLAKGVKASAVDVGIKSAAGDVVGITLSPELFAVVAARSDAVKAVSAAAAGFSSAGASIRYDPAMAIPDGDLTLETARRKRTRLSWRAAIKAVAQEKSGADARRWLLLDLDDTDLNHLSVVVGGDSLRSWLVGARWLQLQQAWDRYDPERRRLVSPSQVGAWPQPVEAELWGDILVSLRRELGDRAFEAWIAPTELRVTGGGALVIVTPTGVARDWIRRSVWRRIGDLWRDRTALRQPSLQSRMEFEAQEAVLAQGDDLLTPREVPVVSTKPIVYFVGVNATLPRAQRSRRRLGDFEVYEPGHSYDFLLACEDSDRPAFIVFDFEDAEAAARLMRTIPHAVGVAMQTLRSDRQKARWSQVLREVKRLVLVPALFGGGQLAYGEVPGELADALDFLARNWPSTSGMTLRRQATVFMRAHGQGPFREDDAWCQLYSRLQRLELTARDGWLASRDDLFNTAPARKVPSIAFPLASEALNVGANADALFFGNVDLAGPDPAYAEVIRHMLAHSGWGLSEPGETGEFETLLWPNRAEVEARKLRPRRLLGEGIALMLPSPDGALTFKFGAPERKPSRFRAGDDELRRFHFETIESVVVSEAAQVDLVMDRLVRANELWVSCRDLAAYRPGRPSVWLLVASQARRLATGASTEARTAYLALLLRSALTSDLTHFEERAADDLLDLLAVENFQERFAIGASSARFDGEALRLVVQLSSAQAGRSINHVSDILMRLEVRIDELGVHILTVLSTSALRAPFQALPTASLPAAEEPDGALYGRLEPGLGPYARNRGTPLTPYGPTGDQFYTPQGRLRPRVAELVMLRWLEIVQPDPCSHSELMDGLKRIFPFEKPASLRSRLNGLCKAGYVARTRHGRDPFLTITSHGQYFCRAIGTGGPSARTGRQRAALFRHLPWLAPEAGAAAV